MIAILYRHLLVDGTVRIIILQEHKRVKVMQPIVELIKSQKKKPYL